MKTFLGFSYNQWHGVLSFFITTILTLFYGFLIFTEISNPALRVMFSLMHGSLWSLMFQGVNESIQAVDNQVIAKYGSWTQFQWNSRDDWRWFFYGVFLAIVVSSLILGISL